MKTPNTAQATPRNCEEISKNLLAYMNRELGKAPSELVSRHLRKCKTCQAEAAEIQATLNLLKKEEAAPGNPLPSRLSDAHRQRLTWTMNHPVLDWFCAHHAAVSFVVALLTLLTLLGLAYRTARVRRETRQHEKIYTISIGQPPAPHKAPPRDTQTEPPESGHD